MDKHTIITLKNQGKSNRETARITGFDRKTVARHWGDYQRQLGRLGAGQDARSIGEQIVEPPRYDSSNRRKVKYTPQIDAAIDEILDAEKEKCRELGITHKQKLTTVQIHELIAAQGFDIGRSTVGGHVAAKRKKAREAFVRQEYDLGERLEYDFGEVRLVIAGACGTYHMAAFASPASGFRWAYLYESQKKDVFADSHARFFEMAGGVWGEVVYDNMRNVVARFIGRNEKQLDPDLVKMSLYYGFSINVTNCFRGNEKGYVESAVKWIRNRAFATHYSFDTLDDARRHLFERLTLLNAASRIEEEKLALLPWRPPLETARVSEHIVDKYSFIRVENCFYSVPDYLVGRSLTVKAYPQEIAVFSGFCEVCRHRRPSQGGIYQVDIFHYLDTLARKPGAVKNSVALRSKRELKEVFDQYYLDRPRDFICELSRLKGLPVDEIAGLLARAKGNVGIRPPGARDNIAENVMRSTKAQLAAISAAFLKGGEEVAC